MNLSRAEWSALEDADSAFARMGWAIFGSRTCRRATLNSLEAKGLLLWEPQCVVCDRDGFRLEPERFREGWFITSKGRELVRNRRVER